MMTATHELVIRFGPVVDGHETTAPCPAEIGVIGAGYDVAPKP